MELIFYALFSSISLFTINLYKGTVSDLIFSILYAVIQMISVYLIWQVSERRLGLFLLFQMTFALFIGGRFITYLLGYEEDIFQPTFFYGYLVSPERKKEIVMYVLLFITFSTIGYCMIRNKSIKPYINIHMSEQLKRGVIQLAKWLFPLFCIYVLYNSISTLRAAMSGGGYLTMYMDQTNDYSGGGKMISNLILLFFCFSFISNNKRLQLQYLLLYLLNAFVFLLIGSRGAIGSMFLFLIWLYSLNHKISLKKTAFYTLLSMLLLLYAFSFSVRSQDVDYQFSPKDLYDIILDFVYNNGISLMVFDASRLLDDYPITGFIQTFIPGTVYIWTLFTGIVKPEDLLFTAHLVNELNPVLFNDGYGLGWTVLSDLYLFSFYGNIVIFTLLSLLLGYSAGCLEKFSEDHTFYKFILLYIFMPTLILPRAIIAAVINQVVYAIFYLIIFKLLFTRKYNN